MEATLSVTFEGRMPPYHVNNIASFPQSEAARLVATPWKTGDRAHTLAHYTTEEEFKARDAKPLPAQPEEMKSIIFTGRVPRYRVGQAATFPLSVARDLVENQHVARWNPDAPEYVKPRTRAEIALARLAAAKQEKPRRRARKRSDVTGEAEADVQK